MNLADLRGRLARADVLAPACCLVALVVYLLHGFDGQLGRDLALYTYAGQRFAEGVPPYVGIANRAGPLAHVIPGLGVIASRMLGVDDVLGVRCLFMLLAIACVALAYLLARDLFRSRLAGVAAAAAMLCFHGFIDYATYGPREKTAMVLFLLAALLAMTRQRWLTTGFLISLATLVWQPAFFGLMAGTVVAVLLAVPVRDWWKAAARVAIGGLGPALVTVGCFLAVGRFQLFLDSFVLINAEYTTPAPLLNNVDRAWTSLTDGYGVSLWVLLAGVVAVPLLAAVAVVRPGRREPHTAAFVGTGVFTVVEIVWTFRDFDKWPDAFVVIPAAAIGVGAVVATVAQHVPRRAALGVTVALAAACTAIALVHSVGARDHSLDRQRASVAAAKEVLPDATIISVRAPQPLVLTGQRQGPRYHLFSNGFAAYIDDTFPGGLRGYARWIVRLEPTLLSVGGKIPPWMAPDVKESYVKVGRAPAWNWYARRDLGTETLRELRRVLDEAPRGVVTGSRS